MNKLRVVGYRIQLIAMSDDGDELTPLQVQPIEVPVAQWDEFVASGREDAIGQLRAQVEKPEAPTPMRRAASGDT